MGYEDDSPILQGTQGSRFQCISQANEGHSETLQCFSCYGVWVPTNTAHHPAHYLHPCPLCLQPQHLQLCPKYSEWYIHLTYSGSLLHNIRHLTQESPDSTDSKGKKGRRGEGGKESGTREKPEQKRQGEGRIQSQVNISDRSMKTYEDLEL